jgi:hypothetical protein
LTTGNQKLLSWLEKMARDERAPFKSYGIGQYGVAL